jgi:hypothetical protein
MDYHKFRTIGQSGFHVDGSHHHDFEEKYENCHLYMSQIKHSNNICLPLHEHLGLWLINTNM